MKYGMTEEQYGILENLVIKPLQRYGAQLFIFGSRAIGKHHPFSDIDLMLRLPAHITISQLPISAIKEAIEESRIPFAVDLVAEVDLAESYKQNILATMKQL